MGKLLTKHTHLTATLLVVLVLLVPTAFAHAAGIDEWLYNKVIVGGFGKIVAWAGIILDYAINTYVVGFGNEMRGSIGVIVNDTWAIIRDLFNLTFIFGLVYIGFKLILRSDDSSTRRWLVNLIIAALLVNFSLFISKFIIDFSNIVAVEVINMGLEPDSGLDRDGREAPVFSHDVIDDVTVVRISESMQDALGVVTTYGEDGAQAGGRNREDGTLVDGDVSMSMVLGTLVIFLVAAFVYFSAGILLIIRAAVLIVLMILSPFLFIGMVLPPFAGTAKQLWDTLLKRAFLAPIYIIFLFITLKLSITVFSGSFAGTFASSDGASAVTNASGSFGPFILVTALLMMSLTAAQKLGAEGASRAMDFTKRGTKWTGKKMALGASYYPRVLARSGFKTKEYEKDEQGRKIKTKPIYERNLDGSIKKNWRGKDKVAKSRQGGISGLGRKIKYGTLGAQQWDQDKDVRGLRDVKGFVKGKIGEVARSKLTEDHVLGQAAPAMEGFKAGFKRDDEAEMFMEEQTKLRAQRRNAIQRAGLAGGAMDLRAAIDGGNLTSGTYEGESFDYANMNDEEKQEFTKKLDHHIAEAEKAVKDTTAAEIANMPDRIKFAMTPFMDMPKYQALQRNEDIPKQVRDMMKDIMRDKLKATYLEYARDEETGAVKIDEKTGEPIVEQILTDQFKKLTGGQLEVLGPDWLYDHAELITNAQASDIKKLGIMSDTAHERFMDVRKNASKAHAEFMADMADREDDFEKEVFGEENISKLTKDTGHNLDTEEGRNAAKRARAAQMMYKIKKIRIDNETDAEKYGVNVGDYVTQAKLKSGKDIAGQIHQDIFKISDKGLKNFARYVDDEWAASFGSMDRAMTKLHRGYRQKIVDAWEEHALDVEKHPEKYTVTVTQPDGTTTRDKNHFAKRMEKAHDNMGNSQAQKNFLGKDPRDKGSSSKSGDKDKSGGDDTPQIVDQYGNPLK